MAAIIDIPLEIFWFVLKTLYEAPGPVLALGLFCAFFFGVGLVSTTLFQGFIQYLNGESCSDTY